jgi:hypothetical protein
MIYNPEFPPKTLTEISYKAFQLTEFSTQIGQIYTRIHLKNEQGKEFKFIVPIIINQFNCSCPSVISYVENYIVEHFDEIIKEQNIQQTLPIITHLRQTRSLFTPQL